ncbi:Abi-alpha family protein [Rhizobium ruizarguesonis]
MQEETKAFEESAKAVQEVAKAAVAYQSSIDDIGAFFGRLMAPVEQGLGLLADYIKGRRLELAVRQGAYIRELMDERGVSTIKRMPLSTAVPLIDAATLEEDDALARMFANLIVSHVDGTSDGYVPKQFTETLKQMSPLEAAVLKAMGRAPAGAKNESGMMHTANLPNSYLGAPTSTDKDIPGPDKLLSIALASLQQSGCIEGAMSWGGYKLLSQARVTEYGSAFLDAVAPV